MWRSTKLPAGMDTEPVAVHAPADGVQARVVSAMLAEDVPRRSVTVMLPDWWDATSSSVAVHAFATQARTASVSDVAALVELRA